MHKDPIAIRVRRTHSNTPKNRDLQQATLFFFLRIVLHTVEDEEQLLRRSSWNRMKMFDIFLNFFVVVERCKIKLENQIIRWMDLGLKIVLKTILYYVIQFHFIHLL